MCAFAFAQNETHVCKQQPQPDRPDEMVLTSVGAHHFKTRQC